MSKLESKSLYNLLKNNDLLPKSVQETLNRLSLVQYHLTELLPGDLQIHCRAINLQGDRLVLAVDSPAWKYQLRFLLPELTRNVQKACQIPIAKIHIIVDPTATAPLPRTPAKRKLSARSQSLIQQAAQGVQDERLRQALIRLARKSRT